MTRRISIGALLGPCLGLSLAKDDPPAKTDKAEVPAIAPLKPKEEGNTRKGHGDCKGSNTCKGQGGCMTAKPPNPKPPPKPKREKLPAQKEKSDRK